VGSKKSASPPEWEAQVIRLSVFLSRPFDGAGTLWKDLTGDPPESDETRQREGSRRQWGVWQGMTLEVQSSAVRLDILAGPEIVPPSPSVTIGPFVSVLESFNKIVRAWLAKGGFSCTRLAIGLVVLAKASDREETYGLLGKLVPSVKFDPDHSREPLYRINRPKKSSTMTDMEFNRLTTWNSILIKVSIADSGTSTKVIDQTYARLECDHSTPAEWPSGIASDQVPKIYDELISMASENALSGELP
jgi:hypothetical protein